MAEKKLKKEHLEILLEDIKGKVGQVAEGHSALRSDIRNMEKSISGKIDSVNLAVNALNNKIDNVEINLNGKIESIEKKVDKLDRRLEEHMRQPAHI